MSLESSSAIGFSSLKLRHLHSPSEKSNIHSEKQQLTSDSISIFSDENNQNNSNIMPKKAWTYWFYKHDEAELPNYFPKNTIDFSHLNPQHQVNVGGNDPGKTHDHFQDIEPDSRYENICFEDSSIRLDTTEFSIIKSLADASLTTSPQITKDLYSYLVSQHNPGLNFDGDTKWRIPLPDKFTVTGGILAHRGYENGAFAYAPHTSDIMGEILQEIDGKIKYFFNINEKHVSFSTKNEQWLQTIVDHVAYRPFRKIVEQYSSNKKLDELLKYEMEFSAYCNGMDSSTFPKKITT